MQIFAARCLRRTHLLTLEKEWSILDTLYRTLYTFRTGICAYEWVSEKLKQCNGKDGGLHEFQSPLIENYVRGEKRVGLHVCFPFTRCMEKGEEFGRKLPLDSFIFLALIFELEV